MYAELIVGARTLSISTRQNPVAEVRTDVAVDVAVVGGGLAGSVAARWLAWSGLHVLLIDEAPDRPAPAGVVHWRGSTAWAAFAPDELGVVHENRAVVVRPRALLLAPGRHRCPGAGRAPSTDLARQLGCAHVFVDRHVGFLQTATSPDGATSVPGVWVARGSPHAVLAAAAIAEALQARQVLPGRVARRARRRLHRAERFANAVERCFPTPAFDAGAVPDAALVCRCEGVTAGRLRSALAAHGADAGTAKRLTRAGMGSCQGRACAAMVARLVAHAGGAPAGPHSFFAPRAPARPIPLGAVAAEHSEWGGHRRSTPPATVPRPGRLRPRWTAPRQTDVLVVGAGVVGACVARALALDGAEVLVVDRDAPGQQASTANAGSLHVQLLSFDFGARAEAGGGPAAETLRLGPRAIALWQDIARTAGEPFDLQITGGLMLADTPEQLAFLQQKAALEARYGVRTAVVGGNELRRLEPHVSPDAVGAAFCAAEGKIDPLRATFAVIAEARRAGAAFEADAPVLAIERSPAGFFVDTAAGPILARRVVNCAGAWSPRISAAVGRPIPVAGAPLQMMVTAPGPPLTRRLLAHAGRHLSLKQTAAGALLIGGGWSAGLDARTGASRPLRWAVEGNAFAACQVLPAAAAFPLLRIWAGMNINIDGAPILGEMPGVPGFWNCVTSNGFTLAPVVAEMTAEAMRSGGSLAPFTLDRF